MVKNPKPKNINLTNTSLSFVHKKLKELRSSWQATPLVQTITKKDIISLLIIIFIVVIISFVAGWFFKDHFSSVEGAKQYVSQFRTFGPVIIVLLIVLEVVIAPLPGFLISISAGYIYGYFWGTVYTWIGHLIGVTLAFFLARKFGRPLAEKLVNFDKLKNYDIFFHKKKKYLGLLYLIPIFPTDLISFASGISSIKYRNFIIIAGIALIPNLFVFNYFGQQIFQRNELSILIAAISLILLTIFLLLILERIRNQPTQKTGDQQQK